jgi:hypothetical protein
MSTQDRLQYEARVRPRQAVIAGLAGVLLLVAVILQQSGTHSSVDEKTLSLIVENKRFGVDLAAAVMSAVGSLGLASTLVWMLSASRARNPQIAGYVKQVAIAGGVLTAVAAVVFTVIIGIKAHQFVTSGSQTYPEANRLLDASPILVLQLIVQAASLLLGIGFVMVSLNAMRVGLLTRFLGYLGIIAGVLVAIPVFPVPILQTYWLLALAYLLSGRWPSGVPPAWSSGRAEPWPSSQELREQRIKAAARRKPAPAAETAGAPARTATRSSAKRKRKRRK